MKAAPMDSDNGELMSLLLRRNSRLSGNSPLGREKLMAKIRRNPATCTELGRLEKLDRTATFLVNATRIQVIYERLGEDKVTDQLDRSLRARRPKKKAKKRKTRRTRPSLIYTAFESSRRHL